ncbi:uncharacterized protein [Watersipora subatra]|uniref:uncharacterized protein n=1 Tax=Watersipora subatra TaxID=2589382 RepID=UPI00355B8D61
MELYGNELCLLDATNKTTKYSLPLFFVVVKTNTLYQIVASFLVSTESQHAITEALHIIKQWNPKWNPDTWMTDYCQAEMSSISVLFPESKVLLCWFHREQAWNRFLVKKENGVSKDDAFKLKIFYLRPLAASPDVDTYLQRKQKLISSDIWQTHTKVSSYFSDVWLTEDIPEKWVQCYRRYRFLNDIDTNNGIESINNAVKRALDVGPNNRRQTLLNMIKKLFRFHSSHYKKYERENFQLSHRSRRYNKLVPKCLQERPHSMIKHVMARLKDAKGLVGTEMAYTIELEKNPQCSCEDFYRHHYPCKHLLSKWINSHGELQLPEIYSNQWWTMDTNILDSVTHNPAEPEDMLPPNHTDSDLPERQMEETTSDAIPSMPLPKVLDTIRTCLDNLRSLTYNITDDNTADKLLLTLKQAQSEVYATLPKKNFLPVFPCRKRKILSSSYVMLSKKKSTWKSYKFAGRVGRKADERVTTLDQCNPAETEADEQVSIPMNIDILDASYCLTSDEIDAGLQLITRQWPDVITQSTLLSQQKTMFPKSDLDGKLCQVVHIKEAGHWIACTNIGGDGTLRVFDSLGLKLKLPTIKILASLMKTPGRTFKVRSEAVQRQGDSTSCGVFSLAYLVELLHGASPAECSFDVIHMRSHIFKCVSSGEWTSFPKTDGSNKRTTAPSNYSYQVYCTCRQPYSKKDGDMIECHHCKEWYHSSCHAVPASAFCPVTGDIYQYNCVKCRQTHLV